MTLKTMWVILITSPFLLPLGIAQADGLRHPDSCVPSTLYVGFKEGTSTPFDSSQRVIDYIVKTAKSENSYILLEGHFDTNEKNAKKTLSSERINALIKILTKNGIPENYIWSRDGFDNYPHLKGFKGREELYSSVSVSIPKQYLSCWVNDEKETKAIIKERCFGKTSDASCPALLDEIGYGGK